MKPSPWEQLAGLRRQLDELEWLLAQSGYDARHWEARATATVEGGKVVLGVVLSRRSNRVVRVMAEAEPYDDDRHFLINGSHCYERHAVGTLKERFTMSEQEEGT